MIPFWSVMVPPRARFHAAGAALAATLVFGCGGNGDHSSATEAGAQGDAALTADAQVAPTDAAAGEDGTLGDSAAGDAEVLPDGTTGDAGGAGDGSSGEAGDAATGDPGPQSAPTAAADPATYDQAIFYKILNVNSGRVLSVQGGGTSDGDTTVLHDDLSTDDQLWAIKDSILGFKKFINKKSGRALSTDHQGGASNGAAAHLWQYTAQAADQDWSISPAAPGAVKITSSARSGAILSPIGGGTMNDTATEVRDDAGGADQGWVVVPVQTFDPTLNYILVNKNSGTALSVRQGGTQNDNPADLYPFINQPDQYWKVVDIGGGYFHFVNGKSGRLLSLTGGDTVNGTIAMIYDDVGATDQAWAIQALPTGFYRLSNQRRPTGCLSIVGAQTHMESLAQIYDDVGARDQSWSIVPVGNTVTVNALDVQSRPSHFMTGVGLEDVNHEVYGGLYSQLIFGESFQEPASDPGVSGMWRSVLTGSATGSFSLPTTGPFQGAQYQSITYASGAGEVGVENRGLNRWGIHFAAGQPYDGYLYARSAASTPLYVAAESGAGTVNAETSVTVSQSTWTRYDFSLTPSTEDPIGRLALKLKAAGAVDVGYVYLEPGPWGRYGGLPVRKDIADAMVSQKTTVLRFGGSAVLASGYRWKSMIGPRALRPTLAGTWYPYDTNGWGIIDFLSFAEAAGVLGIPTLNIDETPSDMADFVDYVNGPTTTTWGAARAADGHPAPFGIHRIELGNEQLIDASFATQFNALAAAIWGQDRAMVLTVGDMSYHDVIANPDQVTGSESGLTTLAPYKTILDFAAAQNGPLAIDLHTWTDTPEQVAEEADAIYSFDFWVHQYNPAVNYALNIYELNAYAHDVGRALGNARAIGLLEQQGRRVRVVTSANALQADGENDNGWDQGLVFYDTQRSWLQPPAYVTQMIAGDELPTVVGSTCTNPDFTVTAKTNGTVMTLEVINMSGSMQAPAISLVGYTPASGSAQVTTLSGNRGDVNAAGNVTLITPQQSSTTVTISGGTLLYPFPPNSLTILRLQ